MSNSTKIYTHFFIKRRERENPAKKRFSDTLALRGVTSVGRRTAVCNTAVHL